MAALRLLRTRALLLSPQSMTRSFLKSDNARTPYAATEVHTTQQNNNTGPSGILASTRWNIEHAVTLAMTAAIPTAFITQHPFLDYVLAGCLTLHGHWGMEQVFTDYIHGSTMPKVAHSCLIFVSALTFAGLCYFNYNDVGITKVECTPRICAMHDQDDEGTEYNRREKLVAFHRKVVKANIMASTTSVAAHPTQVIQVDD